MTENDKKLWKEIESCLEYNDDDIYYGDSVFLHTKSIVNLMALFKNKGTSLLKEFVEWQAKQYKDLYYKYDKEMKEVKDDTDYFWCSGRVAGIGEIRRRLKKDLENFLKEREK